MFTAITRTVSVLFVVAVVVIGSLGLPEDPDAAAVAAGTARVWKMPGDAPIFTVDWAADGRVVAYVDPMRGGEANAVILQPDQPEPEPMVIEGAYAAASVASTPDGGVVLGADDNALLKWNHSGWTQLTPPGTQDEVHKLIGMSGERVIVGYRGHVNMVDGSGQNLWKHVIPAVVRSLSITADERLLSISTLDRRILVVDVASGEIQQEIPTRVCNVASLTPDGSFLIGATIEGSLTLWDVARREIVWIRSIPDLICNDVRVSPDGRRIVAAGDKVTVWNLCGELVETLPARHARCARFSPEGNRVVVGTSDGTLEVHQLRFPSQVNPSLPRLASTPL